MRQDHPTGSKTDESIRQRRNEVERIFSQFKKLDVMFLYFISFMLVADRLRGFQTL